MPILAGTIKMSDRIVKEMMGLGKRNTIEDKKRAGVSQKDASAQTDSAYFMLWDQAPSTGPQYNCRKTSQRQPESRHR